MKTGLLNIALLTGICCQAQIIHPPAGSDFTGAGAYSVRFMDVFSGRANQAALARLTGFSAGIAAEKKFLLKELNNYTVAIGIPLKGGGLGLYASYSGEAAFHASQAGIGYGKRLGKVDLGIQFNYHSLQIAGYGKAAAAGIELGTTWHISDRLHTGIQIVNPAGGKFGRHKEEQLPAVYNIGAGYEVSDQLLFHAILSKGTQQPVNVGVGLQYRVAERLLARAGINTATTTPYIGFGWKWFDYSVSITGSYHPQLGFTPTLIIIFDNNNGSGG